MSEKNGKLVAEFGATPFSVFDARKANWINLRRSIAESIGNTSVTRETCLYSGEGNAESTKKIFAKTRDRASVPDGVLLDILISWFSMPGHLILNPFAGDASYGVIAARKGRRFKGLEIRPDQAEVNNTIMVEKGFEPCWQVADAFAIDPEAERDTVDFVLTSPPYFNLEKYNGPDGDLSMMTWHNFRHHYTQIIQKLSMVLKPNRFAAFVVGEARMPNSALAGLVPLTVTALQAAGLLFWNEFVIVQPCGSAPMRAARPMRLNRKSTRTHQSVIVAYKGDPAEIRSEFDGQPDVDSVVSALWK